MGADQNFFEIRIVGLYPKIAQALKSSAEAQRINLSGKQSIGKIKFVWTKGAERFVEDIEVLKELMPPACLEYFELQGYNGIRFCGTEAGDQRGGEWEPIKISSEIQTVGLYPENHPSPQAF